MTSIKVQNMRSNVSAKSQNSFQDYHHNNFTKDVASPRGGKTKNVWKWFVEFCSIGGFTQARDSDNKVSTLVWTILFLAGFGLTLNGLVTMILFFLEYNSTMNIELAHNSSGMIFPSVAVCNQNRIHCGHLYEKIISCNEVRIVSCMIKLSYYSCDILNWFLNNFSVLINRT